MAKRSSEIVIQFKRPPLSLFRDTATEALTPNALVLKLQPDEGAALMFGAKFRGRILLLVRCTWIFITKTTSRMRPAQATKP